jgi:hypothetical protein
LGFGQQSGLPYQPGQTIAARGFSAALDSFAELFSEDWHSRRRGDTQLHAAPPHANDHDLHIVPDQNRLVALSG